LRLANAGGEQDARKHSVKRDTFIDETDMGMMPTITKFDIYERTKELTYDAIHAMVTGSMRWEIARTTHIVTSDAVDAATFVAVGDAINAMVRRE
jgi:hypothetical protein